MSQALRQKMAHLRRKPCVAVSRSTPWESTSWLSKGGRLITTWGGEAREGGSRLVTGRPKGEAEYRGGRLIPTLGGGEGSLKGVASLGRAL